MNIREAIIRMLGGVPMTQSIVKTRHAMRRVKPAMLEMGDNDATATYARSDCPSGVAWHKSESDS
jgi:hypothetical protein